MSDNKTEVQEGRFLGDTALLHIISHSRARLVLAAGGTQRSPPSAASRFGQEDKTNTHAAREQSTRQETSTKCAGHHGRGSLLFFFILNLRDGKRSSMQTGPRGGSQTQSLGCTVHPPLMGLSLLACGAGRWFLLGRAARSLTELMTR